MTSCLVIGIGHPDRCDDAIGWEVAKRVRCGAQVALASGDPGALIALWQDRTSVIIIDAVTTGRSPGTVIVRDLLTEPEQGTNVRSSHALGPLEAVEIARALDMLPTRLTLVGIEATEFGFSDTMSPAVSEALAPAVATVQTLLDELDG